MNLSVNIAGVTMKNPVTTGSGTFGSGEESVNSWIYPLWEP